MNNSDFLTVTRGIVLDAIANSAHRDDLWKLANDIAGAVAAELSQPNKVGMRDTLVETVDEDDEHLPLSHKMIIVPPRRPPELGPGPTPVATSIGPTPDLDELESVTIKPIWMERDIDLDKYLISRYSNPCSCTRGHCERPCVQTELCLVNRETGILEACDVEFETLQELQIFCDPQVAEYNRQPHSEYIDQEIEEQTQKIKKACRAHREKRRIDQFLEFYRAYAGDSKKIADAMGVNTQAVYNLKNQAKNKGLLK